MAEEKINYDVPPLRSGVEAWQWVQNNLISSLEQIGMSSAGSGIASNLEVAAIIAVIEMSSIVLWRDDLRAAAINGAELFVDTPFDSSLIRFPQLWVYDRSMTPLAGFDAVGARPWYRVECALLFQATEESIAIWNRKGQGIGLKPGAILIDFMLPTGNYEDGFPDRPTIDDVRPLVVKRSVEQGSTEETYKSISHLIAMLNFMNLDIVSTEKENLPRPFRRRLDREGKKYPDIRTIVLRRHHHDHSIVLDRDGNVEWSCQWIVKGHWRKQWYPSKQEHYPVFVMPYVKGPEGKPLKTPTPVVFDVRR